MDYLILPHQLFDPRRFFAKKDTVHLFEEPWYFTKFSYHKAKLVFHRASMLAYKEELEAYGIKVHYYRYDEKFTPHKTMQMFDPIDFMVQKKYEHKVTFLESPLFLLKSKEITEDFKGETSFKMAPFYISQRKRFEILMKNGKPEGGKWSFDTENRQKIPKNVSLPAHSPLKLSPLVKKIMGEIEKEFPENPGSLKHFCFATTRAEAHKKMEEFFSDIFPFFGPYQDALLLEDPFTVHSVLSPYLNVGLLTVDEVLEKALISKAPLSSKEGFIRQILGWREFVRVVYHQASENLRHSNFLKHNSPLPKKFWEGETGILPVDDAVHKALNYAYCHHIERLMVLGNYLLLTETSPEKVYDWFMCLFIDAYDWVMVPNVFGMSQYAHENIMTTKPYFSSANYLKKMGNYPSGPWEEKMQELFWHFVEKHKKLLKENPRLATLLRFLDKK
ncbi:MAG: cryptochrome/photolyase family protein [Chlamydiia bacterium]